MRRYKIISGDGHLETVADYSKYMEKQYAERAPKVVRKPDGMDVWRMDDKWEAKNEGNLYCGSRFDDFVQPTAGAYTFPDGARRPGTGDTTARLREQDIDGIDAEVLYPPVAGPRFFRNVVGDRDFHLALHQGYNNYLADYTAPARDRLIGNATVPETGVDDAIAEMARVKKMGLKSMCLSNWPNGSEYPAKEDDKFWAAVVDMDMVISPHVSMGGTGTGPAVGLNQGVAVRKAVTAFGGPGPAVSQMIETGVLDRYPGLKFYFAETNCGWIPFWLNQMDEFYMRWYKFLDVKLQKMPSQYVRDNCMFNFIQDRMAMKYRHDIGLDLLTWGSDFPHSVGSFPISQEILGELFEGVPEDEKRQVLVENVCRFYDLDPEKELTPTP